MKIYNKPGSKERIFEMFQKVNKIIIKEDVNQGEEIAQITYDGLPYFLRKIDSTHFYMNYGDSTKKGWPYHVGEHEGSPYYEDIVNWLHGGPSPDGKTYERNTNESTDFDKYEDVVFLDGSEADEALEILDNQGEDAALEYLKQWHSPGQHMGSQQLGHGTSDKTYEKDGYIMSWNFPLGYIGLQYDLKGGNLSEDDEFDNLDATSETSQEPQEDDCFVQSNGFKLSVSCGGKFIGQFVEDKDAYNAVKQWKQKNNWYPNTWFIDDHGGYTPVDDDGNFIKETFDSPKEKDLKYLDKSGDKKNLNNQPSKYDGGVEYPAEKSFKINHPSLKKVAEDNNLNKELTNEPEFEEPEEKAELTGAGDEIEGGLADNDSPMEFDSEQILKGMKIEMEHTDDPKIALEIAMDHLKEIPDYYDHLEDMEEKAKDTDDESGLENKLVFGKEDQEFQDNEIEDFNYEPKNVGEDFDFAAAERDYYDEKGVKDDMSRYEELKAKDFNTLPDNEKEEFFQLWQQYREDDKSGNSVVGEDFDFAAAERDYYDEKGVKDDMSRYEELKGKDFNTLPDNEKEEFFQLWQQYKEDDKTRNSSMGMNEYEMTDVDPTNVAQQQGKYKNIEGMVGNDYEKLRKEFSIPDRVWNSMSQQEKDGLVSNFMGVLDKRV